MISTTLLALALIALVGVDIALIGRIRNYRDRDGKKVYETDYGYYNAEWQEVKKAMAKAKAGG